ncbi:MAG TPA: hypothetical protein VGN57_02605 [Pirellulaceae bacterium]|jgi:hypothetical protein|nr:hypothetical protein [Pirellulaceae bacterium]
MLLSAGLRSSVLRIAASSSALAMISLVLGCGGTESPGPSAPPPSVSGETPSDETPSGKGQATTPVVAADSIHEVKRIVNGQGYDLSTGRELPNLKAGTAKATISAPKGWVLPTRRQEYVVWFAKELGEEFPRILVTAEPAPAGTPDTTEANVAEFAQQVAATVADPLESPKPMIVGDVPAARYVTSAKARAQSLEEQVLKTVQKGQVFTVTLQAAVVTPGESPLLQYRDAGYAVLASMKVEAGESPAESPAAQGADAAAPPSETPPVEGAPAGT